MFRHGPTPHRRGMHARPAGDRPQSLPQRFKAGSLSYVCGGPSGLILHAGFDGSPPKRLRLPMSGGSSLPQAVRNRQHRGWYRSGEHASKLAIYVRGYEG
jgi:hypothetical protein